MAHFLGIYLYYYEYKVNIKLGMNVKIIEREGFIKHLN